MLAEHFELEPIREENEETNITLKEGFDPRSVRLTGNVAGQAPFTGVLVHRGWRAVRVDLPQRVQGQDSSIVSPAEVEV